MKCLSIMAGVTLRHRINNVVVGIRVRMVNKLEDEDW